VAAGAYVLIRLSPALAGTGWFGPAAMAVGLTTALAGGVVAALQGDIKRSLAGSTSSQYGLMFLAAGAGYAAASGAHLVTHAAFKSLLFLGAGVAVHTAGSGDLRRMRLGRALPGTALVFGTGILALAAVPPLGGAWTKEEVVAAAFGVSGGIGALALLSGLLTAFYATRLHLLAFGRDRVSGPGRAAAGEMAGMVTLAAFTILLSLLWLPGAEPLVEAAVSDGGLPHGEPWGLGAAVGAITAAAAVAWLLWRRKALFTFGLPEGLRAGAADWLGVPALARAAIGRPTLTLSRALAAFDDAVVDAGVRLAAAVGRGASRLLATWGERGIEGVVRGLTGATVSTARASRALDDDAVDGAVERTARAVGWAGGRSRRLQTGMAHHYYIALAAGLLGAIAVTLFLR
jgi:NADH:ubiquinone oxidoreductase subunit 5 (subunit L)/multisubunit Na+/H+ antiporter MnhA subunit